MHAISTNQIADILRISNGMAQTRSKIKTHVGLNKFGEKLLPLGL